MLKRTLTGATLLAVVLGAWSFDASSPGQPAWALAFLGVTLTLGALYELLTLFPDEGSQASGIELVPSSTGRTVGLMGLGVVWVAVVAMAGLPGGEDGPLGDFPDHVRMPAIWLLFASLITVPLMLALLRRGPTKHVVRLARRVTFMLPYTCGLAALVFILLQGRVEFAVGLVLVAKSSDIGAYFAGKTLGKHKLAPSISPNKTIEGMIGGLLLPALLASWLLADVEVTLDVHQTATVLLPGGALGAACHGLALGALTVFSDLGESLIKRSFAVKDSGHLFGASGGFLDLADSLLLVAPVALAYTASLA